MILKILTIKKLAELLNNYENELVSFEFINKKKNNKKIDTYNLRVSFYNGNDNYIYTTNKRESSYALLKRLKQNKIHLKPVLTNDGELFTYFTDKEQDYLIKYEK